MFCKDTAFSFTISVASTADLLSWNAKSKTNAHGLETFITTLLKNERTLFRMAQRTVK